jgi:hypothetical protein
MGKWVKDAGGSECQSLIGWIGIHILTRKGADFQLVLRCEIVGGTIIRKESG